MRIRVPAWNRPLAPYRDAEGYVDLDDPRVKEVQARLSRRGKPARPPMTYRRNAGRHRFAASAGAAVSVDATGRPDLAGVSKPVGPTPATETRRKASIPPRARPRACGCHGASHGPRCLIPADYDPATGYDGDAGTGTKGCGCAAVKVKTGPWRPESVAAPYNPMLARYRFRVPTLA